jgi:Putative prokaryotic signal transducing protein
MADETQDPEEYVTIAEFIEPVFAQMARGALESAGIECFLEGEQANSLLNAAFWAQLQVHQKDEEAAREILEFAEDSGDASVAEERASDDLDLHSTDPQDDPA